MSKVTSSRVSSFHILAALYLLAAYVGFLIYSYLMALSCSTFLALFVADAVATILIWCYGLMYKNVSVYDPYWSVAPPVMLTAWAISCGPIGLSGILLLIAIWYWGIRLTGNWAYTFRNLDTEDWRYTKYRTEQKPAIFHIINFFGLNMMPTIVVFFAMLPGILLLEGENGPFACNWLTWIGFAICMIAPTIQLIADNQRHRFAKEHKGEVCKVGLWKHGRHPNYFGEIMMWWGVWIMYASVAGISSCLVLIGPVAMTSLFLFISIPLMEGRQLKNKPGYAEYKKETRILI